MSSTYTSNINNLTIKQENAIGMTIRLMLEGIHQQANPITPMKGGALRTMVNKNMETNRKGIIEWKAPYAEYQERGFTTGPVRNYTTPGTQAGFAQSSVENTVNNLEQYARMGGLI